jgi:hypothetical protein
MKKFVINIFLIEDGENSALQIWKATKKGKPQPSWVEVRGNVNWWSKDSTFWKVIDIKRINSSELFAGRTTCLIPEWDGWEYVASILEEQP